MCQCSQWWHSGKDCPPLPSPVRVQGAGHATLPSSTATDHAAIYIYIYIYIYIIFLNENGNGGVAQGGGLSAAPDSRRGEGHATARCVSAVSGGTVSVVGGGTVAGTQAQWVAQCQWWVVAQWEGTVGR